MSGNVQEWCWDLGLESPPTWRVTRGGSFYGTSEAYLVNDRHFSNPDKGNFNPYYPVTPPPLSLFYLGFRVVRSQ